MSTVGKYGKGLDHDIIVSGRDVKSFHAIFIK